MVSRREEPKNRTIGCCWESDKSLTHRIHGTCMFTYIYLHEWFTIHESYANMTRFHWKGMCLINIYIKSIMRIFAFVWMIYEYTYTYIEKRCPPPWFPIKIAPQLMMMPSVPSSKVAFALCGAREVDDLHGGFILNGWILVSKLMRWFSLLFICGWGEKTPTYFHIRGWSSTH